MKPLGYKSYGSIPHLIGSRVGPSDHHAHDGQCKIATEKTRDKHDFIIVQEKLDGGNVGIAKKDGKIIALTRAGYYAHTSPYKTHHAFEEYVRRNEKRFDEMLNEGERICGEWLLTAVGTIYNLPHEPFVGFDIMKGLRRITYLDFLIRTDQFDIVKPTCISMGDSFDIDSMLECTKVSGHGATELVEGAIWRVERKREVDFLVKYVRQEKTDGKYLDQTIVNGMPPEFNYLKDFL